MADTGAKSYQDTSKLGADVDLTGERELASARAYRQANQESDGSEGAEAYGEFDDDRSYEGRGSALYEPEEGAVRSTMRSAGSSVSRLIRERPVQMVIGAAVAGFLFGRFG